MFDDRGKKIKSAGPSIPVEILGLSEVPAAGDRFIVCKDEKTARNMADLRKQKIKADSHQASNRVSLEDLYSQIQEGKVKELAIVVKADVQGSVEAIRQSLEKLSTDDVKVRVIHGAVGAITETDVTLAAASNALVIGFNVRPDGNAMVQSEKENIEIKTYRIIYDAIEDVKTARAHGDLSENFEYHAAKREKNRNESRIRYLQRMIKTAKIISDESADDEVGVNNIVELFYEDDETTEKIKLVTTVRGDSLEGLISIESPLGKALLGHKAGDRVLIEVNSSVSYYVRIKSIENSDDLSLIHI